MTEQTKEQLITLANFKVTSADTDMQARIRLGAYLNLLVQAAIISADNLGFGINDLKKENMTWVLSRLTVEIYRPLMWYESVEIETWPKDVVKFLHLRDFIVRDKNKKVVAKATSGWLAIDWKTKRPGLLAKIKPEKFSRLKDKIALDAEPEKLDSIADGNNFSATASYFDIDVNRHVAATRYIDWMMDSLPDEFHSKNYPSYFSINYMKETMPHEKINFMRRESSGNSFTFQGINSNNDTVAIRAKITF